MSDNAVEASSPPAVGTDALTTRVEMRSRLVIEHSPKQAVGVSTIFLQLLNIRRTCLGA